MAATYGYGGEFSSDEDIDKMEQQAEQRHNQSKFDTFAAQMKPNRHQIEEAIKAIKSKAVDEEVTLSDELLAALLDYYKTQRGPIVDSTRTLYKKIILRLIRNDQQINNGELNKDNMNGNNNNTSNFKFTDNRPGGDLASSDDDEPMPPASSQSSVDQQAINRKNFDSRVVYNDKLEPMEVDSEMNPQQMTIREGKTIDMPTSSESESETDESDSEHTSLTENSEPEVIAVNPPKAGAHKVVQSTPLKDAPSAELVSRQVRPAVRKDKPNVVASEAKAKSNEVDTKKKPYTRSQRIAATKAAPKVDDSKVKKTDVSSSKVDAVATEKVKPLSKSMLTSKFTVRLLISAVVVAVLAFFLYHFKSDLTHLTDRIFKRAIKF